MAIRVTNEVHEGVYNGEPYREHERFVAGERSTASVRESGAYLDICGIPELFFTWDVIQDLSDVLNAAIELRDK